MNATTAIALRVSPNEYFEISKIECFSDGSGCAASLAVRSGHFSCCEHPFYFDGLQRFIEDLANAYDRVAGKARLGHTHEHNFIEFEVFETGQVTVNGRVIQHGPLCQELRFAFHCDQTYLRDLLRMLAQVTAELHGRVL